MQCERLRDALAPFGLECCLVSPMRRCLETREIVAAALPFEIETALREVRLRRMGRQDRSSGWSATNAGACSQRGGATPWRFRPPGGESFEDAAPRLRAVVETDPTGDVDVRDRASRERSAYWSACCGDLPLDSQSVTPLEPGEFRVID